MTSSTTEPRIHCEVQIMFFDTDCAAVVHNIAYLRFIETARTLLAGNLGLSLAEMAKSQQYPVVVRTEIDYKRAAGLGDVLWCGFDVTRPADGALIVRCRQMLALVQMPAGRPIRLPAEWQTRYAAWREGEPSAGAVASRLHGGQVA
jgi:YbgC/YbaW family acyl-CoA thioester hydrolase